MSLERKRYDHFYLTRDLLSELALIAQSKAEAVIKVKNWREMPEGLFACIFLKGDIDLEGHTTLQNTICLLDVINIPELHAVHRPEMDWNKIPRDKTYHFLIYHEVGHALTSPRGFNTRIRLNRDGTRNQFEMEMVAFADEMMADRYAWKELFPSQPFPKKEGCKSLVRDIEVFVTYHPEVFSKYFAFANKNPGFVLI